MRYLIGFLRTWSGSEGELDSPAVLHLPSLRTPKEETVKDTHAEYREHGHNGPVIFHIHIWLSFAECLQDTRHCSEHIIYVFLFVMYYDIQFLSWVSGLCNTLLLHRLKQLIIINISDLTSGVLILNLVFFPLNQRWKMGFDPSFKSNSLVYGLLETYAEHKRSLKADQWNSAIID